MFYSIDGIDGSGKSTQIQLLSDYLTAQGESVVLCRDPGSTDLSEELRNIILHREDLPISRLSAMFLFMAARAQLVQDVIIPALDDGKTVICDRFVLANVVYQGYAGGLNVQTIHLLGEISAKGRMPDRTFVLDLPVETARRRMQVRQLDRIEKEDLQYKQKLRDGFLQEAQNDPRSICLINADQSIEKIHQAIINNL